MEILYFFKEKETPMYQWQRIHFIDELSKHNCHFTFINPLSYNTPAEANEMLVNHVKTHKYDMFLTNICYQKAIFKESVERIKEYGIPTVCFRSDNLTIPFYDKEVGPSFDLVWLTYRETKYLYDRWGINTICVPYAANPYFFKYVNPSFIKRRVCFIGTPHGCRPLLINALTENNLDVDVFYKKNKDLQNDALKSVLKGRSVPPGKMESLAKTLLFHEGRKVISGTIKKKLLGQPRLVENDFFHGFPSVRSEEISSLYSEYALALSSSSAKDTELLRKPLDMIFLRSFEIPMCGGIEICRFHQELAECFDEGKEIVFYRDKEEFVDKVRYYTTKASEAELISMKEAARHRAEGEHTWWNRFTKVFDQLGLKY